MIDAQLSSAGPRPTAFPDASLVESASAWSNVRGIQRVSMCDWPGHISSVLFVGGCNLACPTCHNAALAWTPERLPALDGVETMQWLHARRKWLTGLVVTGGEPSVSPSLLELLDQLAEVGLPIKVDSNGLRPDVVRDVLARHADITFAVDVKGSFAKYPELTGGRAEADEARACLNDIFSLAKERPTAFYFRTTRVPQLTDADMDEVRRSVPDGLIHIEQTFTAPGRNNA